MQRSRIRRRVRIPSATTQKLQTKDYQFVRGLNTNSSNDDVALDQWRYVTDAREVQVGKWDTRKGNDLLSIPIGEAVNVQQNSTTGASTFSFNTTTRWAERVQAGSSGRLTAIEANLLNDADATGTIVLALHEDNSGEVGDEIVRTTIANSSVIETAAYVKARTITCPDIASGDYYWVVGYVQEGGTGSYKVTTTTTASTGDTSTDSGQTWTDQAYAFNVKLSTATATGVKGTIRVKRPNGTRATFIAHGEDLYTVNELTGATTSVDSGLDPDSTYVRFAFVNDTLYYVTGLQKPRKYDFSTVSEVSSAPENAAAIISHKGLVFFLSAVDVTKMFYTNFAQYDTFTSTDSIYVDAPKTADPAVAFSKLNGNLYILTRNNKFILYGSENTSFQLDEAVGQKGTFSQESIAYNQDAVYLASDDGIFLFNGGEEINLCARAKGEGVLDWWKSLTAKENTVLELHNNRLYVFYTPVGESQNSRCMVYHIVYGIWESDDTRAFVNRTWTRFDADNYFVQASNRVGMLMLAEGNSNDCNTMGEPLTWELHTSYAHYDAPAQFKRAPIFRPHFDSVSGTYSVQVGYATDYSDDPTYTSIDLAGTGPRFDTGVLFDSGALFGGAAQINPMDDGVTIPGEWRRLQIRYKHEAAREPVSFDGHVLGLEIQRML